MVPLLVLTGLLIGGIAIAANWKAIVDWLKDFIPKLRETWKKIRENVPYGAKIVGDLVVKGLDKLAKIMHKLYYQEDNHWVEETTTRIVSESEVPPEIVAQIKRQKNQNKNKDVDITAEMEEELQLEV